MRASRNLLFIKPLFFNKRIHTPQNTLQPRPSPVTLTLHPHLHPSPFALTRCRTTTSSPSASSTSGLTGASMGTPSTRWCAATRARSTPSLTWSRTSSAQSRACRPRSGARSPARETVREKEGILDTHTRNASPAKPADDQQNQDSSTYHRRAA
jgi:hypothetical protein